MSDVTNRQRFSQRCSSCGEYWWDAHVCPHSVSARQTLPLINPKAKTVQEMADEIDRLRVQCKMLMDDKAALQTELAQAIRAITVGSDMEQEVERLREQLALAKSVRAAQVAGLVEGAEKLREEVARLTKIIDDAWGEA